MEMKRFLFCFSTREGSIMCGIGTLITGVLRIYFLWFNMFFLHRLTETQIDDLPLSLDGMHDNMNYIDLSEWLPLGAPLL
ncbi:hypothetical protein QZH41_012784 [Actinostola sp. cb2023]|nr:hypothetical protein QZH41_012784 [Actinostola sp. cb2023]